MPDKFQLELEEALKKRKSITDDDVDDISKKDGDDFVNSFLKPKVTIKTTPKLSLICTQRPLFTIHFQPPGGRNKPTKPTKSSMDLDDDFFGLKKEPVTAVSKNKKSILDSSDDEDGEPSFSFLKTGTKKGIRSVHES